MSSAVYSDGARFKVTHVLQGVDMVLVNGNYEVVDRTDGTKVGLGRFAHIWTTAPDRRLE
jgi:hypothetical protein